MSELIRVTLTSMGREVRGCGLAVGPWNYDCDGITLGFKARDDAGAMKTLDTMPTPNMPSVEELARKLAVRKLNLLITMLGNAGVLKPPQIKQLNELG